MDAQWWKSPRLGCGLNKDLSGKPMGGKSMTRAKLNKLLAEYARAAYWHGEETGQYGKQDPDVHKEIEQKLWDAIREK